MVISFLPRFFLRLCDLVSSLLGCIRSWKLIAGVLPVVVSRIWVTDGGESRSAGAAAPGGGGGTGAPSGGEVSLCRGGANRTSAITFVSSVALA